MKFVSHTGKTYNRLTVIKDERGVFVCRCECGKECRPYKGAVTNGITKSCGCLANGRRAVSLVGERSGKLECITENGGNVQVQCDCGRTKIISRKSFRSTFSCGCKHSRYVAINGEERHLSGWAELLGLSRERARQLHARGKLEERVEAHYRTKRENVDEEIS